MKKPKKPKPVTGADVRAFRDAVGLTLKELAKIAHVAWVTLWKMEQRKSCPRTGVCGWIVDLAEYARGVRFTDEQKAHLAEQPRVVFIGEVVCCADVARGVRGRAA